MIGEKLLQTAPSDRFPGSLPQTVPQNPISQFTPSDHSSKETLTAYGSSLCCRPPGIAYPYPWTRWTREKRRKICHKCNVTSDYGGSIRYMCSVSLFLEAKHLSQKSERVLCKTRNSELSWLSGPSKIAAREPSRPTYWGVLGVRNTTPEKIKF